MIDEKIIDAVGMLDEEFIFQTELKNTKKTVNLKRTIAAVLVLLIFSIVFIINGLFISSHRNTETLKFSYNRKKLLKICRIDLNTCEDKKQITEEDEFKELYSHVGARVFGVIYADGEKVIITTGKGIFIYNYQQDQIINNYDLDRIGVPGFNQGDSSSSLSVDISGKYAVMQSCEGWTSSDREIEYRIINFENGEIIQVKKEETPKDFTPFETEDINFYSNENKNLPFGRAGEIAAAYTNENGETFTFYTNIEVNTGNIETEGIKALVGNTDLVIVAPDKSYTTQRIFGSLFSEFKKRK